MIGTYDVVVIGAGPIGGFLSRRLNEFGHSVLLIEEHSEIGRPFQCAGLVNPKAMETVNLQETILSEIWGANIHSPMGNKVSIGDPEVARTYSVCRKLFDESVVMQSLRSGTELMLSSKPTSVSKYEDRLRLTIRGPNGEEDVF